jgi:small subunit ribosomal protein S7
MIKKLETKLFGKYEWNAEVKDKTLAQYISINPVIIPHSHARLANKHLSKGKVNIVERLVNKLMRGGTGEKIGGKLIRTHGKLQGKKSKAIKIVENAFEEISKKGKNPIQTLVSAVENSAPREDVTRIRLGGVAYQNAVDISALRRLDVALRNLTIAAIINSFDKKMTMSEALADELVKASENSQDSYAVKKKNEIERMAKSVR